MASSLYGFASAHGQSAREQVFDEPGHHGEVRGAFTVALLEALSEDADAPDESITSERLMRFVPGRVNQLTNGHQTSSFQFEGARPIVFREASSKEEVADATERVVASATSGTRRDVTGASPTPRIASDRWAMRDALGYDPFARTIATLITHPDTLPPLTIGIKAPWGAGKTSLMKRVQYLLDGTASVTEENEAARRTRGIEVSITLKQLLQGLEQLAQETFRPETFAATGHSGNTQSAVTPVPQQGQALRRERLGQLLRLLKKASDATVGTARSALDRMRPSPQPSKEGADAGIPPRMTVWFNAWKYQTSEQIWAGLAHCIISQITARMKAVDREVFWMKLHASRVDVNRLRWEAKLVVVRELVPWLVFSGIILVGGAILLALNLVTLGLIGLTTAPLLTAAKFWHEWSRKLGEKVSGKFRDLVREPDYEGKLGFLHLVESDMREVLDLVSTPQQPLVIFVDDLDRCAPHKVSEVVEAINLFLSGDYPNCIFVLGMEPAIVAAALEVANKDLLDKVQAFGLMDTHVPLGWRFMEKVIQLPVAIPAPDHSGARAYLSHLTGGTSVPAVTSPNTSWTASVSEYVKKLSTAPTVDEVVKRTSDLLSNAPEPEKWAIAEASKRAYAEKFTDRDPAISHFIERTLALFQGNPRQLKRYVNVFRFVSTLRHNLLMDRAATGVAGAAMPSDEALTKFIALSVHWPQAADYLRLTRREGQHSSSSDAVVTTFWFLERGARDLAKESPQKADELWLMYLKALRLDHAEWLRSREFREFLAEGEAIAGFTATGLW